MKIIQMMRIITFRMFHSLTKQDTSNHFVFYYSHQEPGIEELIHTLESHLVRISGHFGYQPARKIKVFIYEDLPSFHYYACGLKSLPNWVVGMADRRSIRMVSPQHEGAVHHQNDFDKIIVHELTHVVIHNQHKNSRIPTWLHEGIAVYEANQMTHQSAAYIANAVSEGKMPSLAQLECDSISFGNRNGYDWAYTIIHFIVHHYGYLHLRRLCDDPLNFEGILGCSKSEFEKKWITTLTRLPHDHDWLTRRMNGMILVQSANLSIRELKEEDIPLLAKWLSDPAVLEYYEGRDRPHDEALVWRHFYENRDDVIPGIIQYQGLDIGYIQFYLVDGEERKIYGYEHGYETIYGMDQFIGEPAYWNRGIGTALMRMMVRFLMEEKKADYIVMDPQAWNARALNVYEKCGFMKKKLLTRHEWHEGEYRDCWLMEYRKGQVAED